MKIQTNKIDLVKCFFIITTIIFTFFWIKGCSRSSHNISQIVKVNIPEVKAVFEAKKPVNIPLENGNIKKSVTVNNSATSKDILQVENPINAQLLAENEQLKADYKKATQPKKDTIFQKVVQLNNFHSTSEDSLVKIDIDGVVQGEVKSIKPSYTLKQRSTDITVIPKETVFRLLGGLEIGNNKLLSNPLFKANLGFQNHKGNVISVSYDNNQNYYIGYHFSIFDIRR